MEGWLKLHRALIAKPIWTSSTPEQKTVLITLLCMVNFAPNSWEWLGRKISLEPGQVITSLESLAEKCGKGISIKNVRTALKRFQKLGFLIDKPTNTGRLITIINWDLYQSSDIPTSEKRLKKVKNLGDKPKSQNQVANKGNFEQRGYDNDYLESLYSNNKFTE